MLSFLVTLFRSVAAKRQYMGKTRLLHVIGNGENVLFGGADTGHMGNCRDVKTVLDEGSQLHSAFGTAAACAVLAFVLLPVGSRSRISPASRMMRTYLYLAANALSFRVFMMCCSIPAARAESRGRPR